MTQLSNAIALSTRLTDDQVAELRAQILASYIDPKVTVRNTERSRNPERFSSVLGGYRFGDWIGRSPELDRPYTGPTEHDLSPATRAMGRWESTQEQQRRISGWLDEDEHSERFPSPEAVLELSDIADLPTADEFNDVQVVRRTTKPQEVNIRGRRLTGQLGDSHRHEWGQPQELRQRVTSSVEVDESVDITRPPVKWAQTDWEPLRGIDLETGNVYDLMSAVDPQKPLTRFREGLDRRTLASSNFEDPADELLQLDLLMEPGWGCSHDERGAVSLDDPGMLDYCYESPWLLQQPVSID